MKYWIGFVLALAMMGALSVVMSMAYNQDFSLPPRTQEAIFWISGIGAVAATWLGFCFEVLILKASRKSR